MPHTVADHLAAAVSALGRQRMNGTLKTIENMGPSLQCDFKRLVILVSTSFTSRWYFLLFKLIISTRECVRQYRRKNQMPRDRKHRGLMGRQTVWTIASVREYGLSKIGLRAAFWIPNAGNFSPRIHVRRSIALMAQNRDNRANGGVLNSGPDRLGPLAAG